MRTLNRSRRTEAGFTLAEVMVALAILALTATVLLGRRVEIVQEAGRSRDLRIVWALAAQKMAELELDDTIWAGAGGGSNGDFSDLGDAYEGFTWRYEAAREFVETNDLMDLEEKPREIFRVALIVEGPEMPEAFRLESLMPLLEPKP